MKPSLIVGGHSHSVAMGVPATGAAADPWLADVPDNGADVRAVGGSWPRDEAYWQMLIDQAGPRSPVIVWDGNQHQAAFLFAPAPPLDFVNSSRPDLPVDENAWLVPEAHVRALFAPSLEPLALLLTRLGQATDAPIYVCGTPPPKGDPEHVRALIAHEPHFVHWAALIGQDVAKVQLTGRWTMLKLWHVVQDLTRDSAAGAGSVFVPVPARLLTDEGFLGEAYWSGDVTHANLSFGQEMLAEVIAAASSGKEVA